MSSLLLLFFSLFISTSTPLDKGKIVIKVDGLKEQSGSIGIMVFNNADGFPTEKEKSIAWKEFKIEDGVILFEIDDLPMGKYAVSLVHDVNDNKKLDKNIFGIPIEPFGFSGNKSILFGLPKFEEAAFELNTLEVESRIELIEIF